MKRTPRLRAVASLAACLVLTGAGLALATPSEGRVENTELSRGTLVDPVEVRTKGSSDYYVQRLELAPKSLTGWHHHPGAEVGVVNEGAVMVFTGPECDNRTYRAAAGDQPGQAYYIPAGTIHMVENPGPDTAELYVTYMVPAGSTLREEIHAPNCPS